MNPTSPAVTSREQYGHYRYHEPSPKRFVCGAHDDSNGNLWVAVKHARGCHKAECREFLRRFEEFKSRWMARFRSDS